MINDEQMIELFARFQAVRRESAGEISKVRILRPDDYDPPSQVSGLATFVFKQMAGGFIQSLLGETNRFVICIHHADSWFKVAQGLDEVDRTSLLWEFADPHFEMAVGHPYSLKNQFVFAAAHLIHQSNKLKVPTWKDDLPEDREIDYKVLERLGNNWNSLAAFKEKLAGLNDEEFRKSTHNFRHKAQHRYRVNFDCGLTPVFERIKTEKGITYSYGAILPINLEKLIPKLYAQHRQAMDAFLTFWKLVNEMRAEWDIKYGEPLVLRVAKVAKSLDPKAV